MRGRGAVVAVAVLSWAALLSGARAQDDCLTCPANSNPKRECPTKARHCECWEGYGKRRKRCERCEVNRECPPLSRPVKGKCVTKIKRHCKCVEGFVMQGGACVPEGSARPSCLPLTTSSGKENRINLIMLPSLFEDQAAFQRAAWRTFLAFISVPELDGTKIDQLNYFMAWPESGSQYEPIVRDGYCHFGCSGIPRLLCCESDTAKLLAVESCGSGFKTQLLVLHGDETFGGAGGSVATASIHPAAPRIAVHEIGHSLFGLGDEYASGWATPETHVNCAHDGCSKWDGLVEPTDVGCLPGYCEDAAHSIGEVSIMYSLNLPFGAINSRATCCKYRQYGAYPAYCNAYARLDAFCDGVQRVNFQDTGPVIALPTLLTARLVEGSWVVTGLAELAPGTDVQDFSPTAYLHSTSAGPQVSKGRPGPDPGDPASGPGFLEVRTAPKSGASLASAAHVGGPLRGEAFRASSVLLAAVPAVVSVEYPGEPGEEAMAGWASVPRTTLSVVVDGALLADGEEPVVSPVARP